MGDNAVRVATYAESSVDSILITLVVYDFDCIGIRVAVIENENISSVVVDAFRNFET